MASASHGQRQIAVARGSNGRLDIFDRLAMDDSVRNAADRLWPDCRRRAVSGLARHRHMAGEPVSERAAESLLDQLTHSPVPVWVRGASAFVERFVQRTLLSGTGPGREDSCGLGDSFFVVSGWPQMSSAARKR